MGEKWIHMRGALGPGDTVTILDDNDARVEGVPAPLVVGPGEVRLTMRHPQVGDIVDAGTGPVLALPDEDGYQIEFVATTDQH